MIIAKINRDTFLKVRDDRKQKEDDGYIALNHTKTDFKYVESLIRIQEDGYEKFQMWIW